MTIITEVADGIYHIETGQADTPDSPGTPRWTAYLLVADGQTALIETGPAVAVPGVINAIHELGYEPSELACIMLTHIHLDHAGGSGTWARQFPHLEIVTHKRGAQHLINPSRLIEGTRQAFGENFEEEFGPILPIPEQQVHPAEDGEVITVGDRELTIFHAPGHAPHHICIYEPKSKGIFSGEALGIPPIENNIVPPVAGFDLDAALNTIDRMSALQPEIIFHSHGGATQEAARLIETVRANTKAFGEIILEGLMAGQGEEQISESLAAYEKERNPDKHQHWEHHFNEIIPWFVAYFKRKGFI